MSVCKSTGQFLANTQIYFQGLLAKQLVRLAFSLASWNDCGGNAELDPKKALKMGEKAVDEAITISEQVSK